MQHAGEGVELHRQHGGGMRTGFAGQTDVHLPAIIMLPISPSRCDPHAKAVDVLEVDLLG